MSAICDYIIAPAIQEAIDNRFLANNLRSERLPFLSYIMAEQNRNAASLETIMSRDGKIRQVELTYTQPLLTSQVKDGRAACVAERQGCRDKAVYDFTADGVHADLRLSVGSLSESAETNSQHLAVELQKMMNAVKERISEDLAAWAVLNFGAWSQDTANVSGTAIAGNILQVNTTIPNGTQARPANPFLFEQIDMALQLSRLDEVGIFGTTELAQALRRHLAGADNTALGFSVAEMLARYGKAIGYDRHLATALTTLGTATNLAVGIGSIAPVGYALYETDMAKANGDTRVADVIYDPETGMKFDYSVVRDCDDWSITLTGTYQFFGMPNDLYQVGSNYEGWNGFAAINAVCDDLTPCQSEG